MFYNTTFAPANEKSWCLFLEADRVEFFERFTYQQVVQEDAYIVEKFIVES